MMGHYPRSEWGRKWLRDWQLRTALESDCLIPSTKRYIESQIQQNRINDLHRKMTRAEKRRNRLGMVIPFRRSQKEGNGE